MPGMTKQDEFMAEFAAAAMPVLAKYASMRDPSMDIGFFIGALAGFAAGVGVGAGLDRDTTLLLVGVGGESGWASAEAERVGPTRESS